MKVGVMFKINTKFLIFTVLITILLSGFVFADNYTTVDCSENFNYFFMAWVDSASYGSYALYDDIPSTYWDNWDNARGGTNIGVGFRKAKNVVKEESNSEGNDFIVLFSDGVANVNMVDGKAYFDDNYPIVSNDSTKFAVNQGIKAQEYADVITVAYLGAYNGASNLDTQLVASNTLNDSQNAGYFTTNDIGYMDNLFASVVSSLDYVGTDTTFTEVINEDFEVVSSNGATVSEVNPTTGQTTITWNIGNLDNVHDIVYVQSIRNF
jgi:hypothetical protein